MSEHVGRERLPNRRMTVTETVEWGGKTWLIGVGFNAHGEAREVFVNGDQERGVKPGSEYLSLMQDACIVLSLLLQHGQRLADLVATLDRHFPGADRQAASPIALAARRVLALERDSGPMIAEALADRAATDGLGEAPSDTEPAA